ncbi:MAG: calcium-binding protein [Xenococcaceae cyanobacterium MO_167.B27]|nr:calcium-binding protein [Xenococcaceae cyanobacterium MO_167.B27]
MSSVLELPTTGSVFENDGGGLDVIGSQSEDNFIRIGEADGDDSAADPGEDFVLGGLGADIIFTSDGDDLVVGGAGDDIIDGGAGSDIIRGGEGADIIRGGEGADLIIGGEGADIFEFQVSDFADGSTDSVLDFEAGDRIIVNGSDSVTLEGNEIKLDGETIINITGGVPDGVTGEYTDDDTFQLF